MLTIEQKNEFSNEFEARKNKLMVKVWNKDSEDYQQYWHEELIHIPKGKYIMMPFSEAKVFKLSDPPKGVNRIDSERLCVVVKNIEVEAPDTSHIIESMKGIRNSNNDMIEKFYDRIENKKEYACPVCDFSSDSSRGLVTHLSVKHKQ